MYSRMLRPVRLILPLAALALLAFPLTACDDDESGDGSNATAGSTGESMGDDGTSTTDSGDAETSSSDAGTDAETGADAEPTSTTGEPGACNEVVPSEGAALLEYLREGSYRGFAAESGPHDSAGPHFGNVQTYINDCLLESLSAGNEPHPQGAAAVKELYGEDGTVVRGWAVMVKVAGGTDADGWYWYEVFDGREFANSVDAGLCVDCHASAGPDGIRSPFPLQ